MLLYQCRWHFHSNWTKCGYICQVAKAFILWSYRSIDRSIDQFEKPTIATTTNKWLRKCINCSFFSLALSLLCTLKCFILANQCHPCQFISPYVWNWTVILYENESSDNEDNRLYWKRTFNVFVFCLFVFIIHTNTYKCTNLQWKIWWPIAVFVCNFKVHKCLISIYSLSAHSIPPNEQLIRNSLNRSIAWKMSAGYSGIEKKKNKTYLHEAINKPNVRGRESVHTRKKWRFWSDRQLQLNYFKWIVKIDKFYWTWALNQSMKYRKTNRNSTQLANELNEQTNIWPGFSIEKLL